MTIIRTQVTMLRKGRLPEDAVVNTFTWDGDTLASDAETIRTNYPGLRTRIETFYKNIQGFLAVTLDGTVNVKGYNLADPKPRAPFDEYEFPIAVPAGAALPGEVALCLSMTASRISGLPMARRRGRVYIGPLAGNMATLVPGAPDMRPNDVSAQEILRLARIMATGSGGAFRLAIHSPRTLSTGASLGDSTHDVVSLHYDNAFDTMRSRGSRATARNAVPVP